MWSEGHGGAATQSTLHQRDDWSETCRATPVTEGTIVERNGEDEEERESEKLGVCALIDLWSEGLCPLICMAEEKGFGLRCFSMSLFELWIPVRSQQELFHHLIPADLQLPSPVACGTFM